jgi:hypothetical protein
MKCIQENPSSWGDKVNYVDVNNRVLGFSLDQSCCEIFGHGVFVGAGPDAPSSTDDIDAYSFVDEPPAEPPAGPMGTEGECGGRLAFRITADGKPDLWVHIWNHHNGYYSHGWTSWRGEGSL